MQRVVLYAYLVIALLEVAAEYFGYRSFILALKPLLMPVLIGFHWISNHQKPNSIHQFLFVAFGFSWLGDVFLMFTGINENFFLFGLVAFLIAHLLYIYIFTNKKYLDNAKSVLSKKPLLAAPYILLTLGLISMIMPGLLAKQPEMVVPVLVYTAVILTMVLSAFNRYGKVNKQSFVLVFTAALTFMFSDSLIALDRFTDIFDGNESFSRVGIMTLYTAAQLLFSLGITVQYNTLENGGTFGK